MQLYNTLTKKKEVFIPLKPKKVSLYVCGLTVYDYFHIGNARVFIIFDVLVRYLRHLGFNVCYVRNITDIDDKIIDRAHQLNISISELTKRFITAMHEDEQALQNISPSIEPKASENMTEIVHLIDTLINKGYAYVTADGDVYYEVNKFKTYGEFANQNLAALRSGARISISEIKRDPLDFTLWKKAKPGEPAWESPWGLGRPGWHSECAVMATKHLGETFDIHGGGNDLKFPHHQNEIAQAEAYFDHKIVNYWLHVGFVEVNHEKMSKSLGNFFTLREVLKIYHPEVVRLFILSSHYRSPLDYSNENLDAAKTALQRLYSSLKDLPMAIDKDDFASDRFYTAFIAAMDDDLNTPLALSHLFSLSHEINKLRTENNLQNAAQYGALLKHLGSSIFGILEHDPEGFLNAGKANFDTSKIETLIKNRETARKNKNWQEADKIRAELKNLGVELEDTANGTEWKIANPI